MNIFLVTSCIKPTVGIINFEDRYKQTLETFDSIKLKLESSIGGLHYKILIVFVFKVKSMRRSEFTSLSVIDSSSSNDLA